MLCSEMRFSTMPVRSSREALNVLTQHLGGVTEEDVRRLARMAIRDDGAISGADIARARGQAREARGRACRQPDGAWLFTQ